jgi:hypothetical protein
MPYLHTDGIALDTAMAARARSRPRPDVSSSTTRRPRVAATSAHSIQSVPFDEMTLQPKEGPCSSPTR